MVLRNTCYRFGSSNAIIRYTLIGQYFNLFNIRKLKICRYESHENTDLSLHIL